MSRARFVAAIAVGALLVATGVLAARATPVHDGTYLGYVRTLPGAGSMVAVDSSRVVTASARGRSAWMPERWPTWTSSPSAHGRSGW